MGDDVNTTYSVIKTVNELTKLSVTSIIFGGERKYVLIDQFGEVVGLPSRSEPYYLDLKSASSLATKGMRNGLTYKSYAVQHIDTHTITLDCFAIHEDEDEAVDGGVEKKIKSSIQEVRDLYRSINGREYAGGCIDCEYTVI